MSQTKKLHWDTVLSKIEQTENTKKNPKENGQGEPRFNRNNKKIKEHLLKEQTETEQEEQTKNSHSTVQNLLNTRREISLPSEFQFKINLSAEDSGGEYESNQHYGYKSLNFKKTQKRNDETISLKEEAKDKNSQPKVEQNKLNIEKKEIKFAPKFDLEKKKQNQNKNKNKNQPKNKKISNPTQKSTKLSKFVREPESSTTLESESSETNNLDSDVYTTPTTPSPSSKNLSIVPHSYQSKIYRGKFEPQKQCVVVKQDSTTHKYLVASEEYSTKACRERFESSVSVSSLAHQHQQAEIIINQRDDQQPEYENNKQKEAILNCDFDKILSELPKGDNFRVAPEREVLYRAPDTLSILFELGAISEKEGNFKM